MKTKKIFFLLLAGMFVFGAVSCGEKPVTPEDELMAYSEIYKKSVGEAYSVNPAAARHKASHGYHMKSEQGYNGWCYLAGGALMTYSNGAWQGSGAKIEGALMTPSASADAVREFTVPKTGAAKIYGNIKMNAASVVDINFKVAVNGTVVYPVSSDWAAFKKDDTEGLYHESNLTLNESDKICFIVNGTGGDVYWNPTVDTLGGEEKALHDDRSGKYYGDVHPYWEDGTMYMFHLETETPLYASRLAVSTDMLTYAPAELKMSGYNPPEQPLYPVVNVLKNGDTYITYCGIIGGGIVGSVSKDLYNWESATVESGPPDFTVARKVYWDYDMFPYAGRDPHLFWDPDINRYRMTSLAYYVWSDVLAKWSSAIGLFTSKDGQGSLWDEKAKPLLDFPNRAAGEPECTYVIKMKNRWYILTSLSGITTHWVGGPTYWVGNADKRIDNQNWNKKPQLRLDGEDLCAAQFVNVGNRVYMYGWITRVYNQGQWGGYLNLPREVFMREDGTLGARLDPYLTQLLKHGKVFSQIDGGLTVKSGLAIADTGSVKFEGEAKVAVTGQFGPSMITADVMVPAGVQRAGFILEQSNKSIQVVLARRDGKIWLQVGDPADASHKISSEIAIGDDKVSSFALKAVVEGGCIEFFANNEWALSARTSMNTSDYGISLYSSGAGTQINNINVYRLSSAENAYD